MNKLHVRKDDEVVVISGNSKGDDPKICFAGEFADMIGVASERPYP